MRKDIPMANKVSIMQGSGSGHEPAHVMIVGKGMLDAACPGQRFCSNLRQILFIKPPNLSLTNASCTCSTTTPVTQCPSTWGVNSAEADGIKVRTVVINDDVAVKDSLIPLAAVALLATSL